MRQTHPKNTNVNITLLLVTNTAWSKPYTENDRIKGQTKAKNFFEVSVSEAISAIRNLSGGFGEIKYEEVYYLDLKTLNLVWGGAVMLVNWQVTKRMLMVGKLCEMPMAL